MLKKRDVFLVWMMAVGFGFAMFGIYMHYFNAISNL